MYEKVKCEVSKQYGKTATKLLGLSKSSEKSLSEPTSSKAKQTADGHQDKHSKRTPSKRTRKSGADIEEDRRKSKTPRKGAKPVEEDDNEEDERETKKSKNRSPK